jgi:hypothetical protein
MDLHYFGKLDRDENYSEYGSGSTLKSIFDSFRSSKWSHWRAVYAHNEKMEARWIRIRIRIKVMRIRNPGINSLILLRRRKDFHPRALILHDLT